MAKITTALNNDGFMAMAMNIYSEPSYGKKNKAKYINAVLANFNNWLAVADKERFTHYKNENSKGIKDVSKAALNQIKKKLEKNGDLILLRLFSIDEQLTMKPPYISNSFELWDNKLNEIKLALPTNQLTPHEFLNLFIDSINVSHLFVSASAGHTFVYNPGRCYAADNEIREMSKESVVIDVFDNLYDVYGMAQGRLRTINWLTAINNKIVTELGGVETIKEKLSAAVGIHTLKAGIVLQAGKDPILGDKTQFSLLKPYVEVDKLLKPITAKYFNDDDRKGEFPDSFFKRFEKFH
ncbi:MAG: DUF3396 domain-containing protein [Planctomycetota bacterium]|nr:DUF3396 domain-containing protein [Planctomycetota bacterium]